jgi:ubiquinone/menaquinone biosynthesis C-methylase UbiE
MSDWITVPKLGHLTDEENVERERYINCFAQGKDSCDGNWGKSVGATDVIRKMNVKSICDVGCGVGNWLIHCVKTFDLEEVYGIDPASIFLSKTHTHEKIQYMEGTAKSIPLPDNSVDCVTSFEVLEHVLPQYIDESLQEIARVTKRYAILLVCLKESVEFEGKNNHPCIMTQDEWTNKMKQHFSSVKITIHRNGKSVMYECEL